VIELQCQNDDMSKHRGVPLTNDSLWQSEGLNGNINRLQNTSTADKDLEGLSATDAVGLSDLKQENFSQIEKVIVWRRKREGPFPIPSDHHNSD
jgi:hypothetical protein